MCNTSPHTLSDSSPRFRSRHCLPGNASPVANDVGTCKVADRRICTACIKCCDFIGISNPFDCVIPQVGLCFLFFQLSHWRIKITGCCRKYSDVFLTKPDSFHLGKPDYKVFRYAICHTGTQFLRNRFTRAIIFLRNLSRFVWLNLNARKGIIILGTIYADIDDVSIRQPFGSITL